RLGDASAELVHFRLDSKHNFVMIARGPAGSKYPSDTVWKLHSFAAACRAFVGKTQCVVELDRAIAMTVLPGHGFPNHLVKNENQVVMKHIFPSSIRNSITISDLVGFAKRLPA